MVSNKITQHVGKATIAKRWILVDVVEVEMIVGDVSLAGFCESPCVVPFIYE